MLFYISFMMKVLVQLRHFVVMDTEANDKYSRNNKRKGFPIFNWPLHDSYL